ncbi:hypothetical protein M407DRAFT_20487 [Tulasnella calospora MUT 4182]|uniref:Protein kinase domain-containing protein n=1 Tax=Tulasnella calospora MUT 4182 TaxID=1051891 RepID=A0A0C3L9B3_9AGAM|nr:hypothetical protein M407DRAFT_20487 [Tulasnella calospora MUT 4182]
MSNALETRSLERAKRSAREVFESLSNLRVNPTRIKPIGNDVRSSGGQGDVILAALDPDPSQSDHNDDSHQVEGQFHVAVKKLKFDESRDSEKFFKSFANEVEVQSKLSHPNVVKMLGFVEDMENSVASMLYQWEENGNLRELLRSGEWEIPERLSLIQDVADGLEYLHSRDPPICHGDLKSLNILVASNYRAMITDFGSARFVRRTDRKGENKPGRPDSLREIVAHGDGEPTQAKPDIQNDQLTLTGPAWSLRWAAPEVLLGEDPGLPSDIWALGWICWEAMTDCLPFSDLYWEPAITVRIFQGKLPSIRANAQLSHVIKLCSLITDCWKHAPSKRPSALSCRKEISWMPISIPTAKNKDGSRKIRSAMLLYKLGEMHRMRDENVKALSFLREALEVAKSTGDSKYIGMSLIRIGHVHMACSHPHDAELAYMQARDACISTGHESGRAEALNGLGAVLSAWSRHEEAEAAYQEARTISISHGDIRSRVDALEGLGALLSDQSRYAEAILCYTEAMDICDTSSDLHAKAHTALGLAIIHRAQSEHTKCETLLDEARTMYTRIGDRRGQAHVLVELGHLHSVRSQYTEAEACFTQAHNIFDQINFQRGVASCFAAMGNVHRARSHWADAIEFYHRAAEAYERIGEKHGRANVLLALGHIQRLRSQFEDAERWYIAARDTYHEIGDQHGRANVLLGLGEIYSIRSSTQQSEAEALYVEAREIFGAVGDELGGANALLRLADLQRTQRKYTEAETAYTESRHVYQRIGNRLGITNALLGLGHINLARDNYPVARSMYWEARVNYIEIGDGLGAANALVGLGNVYLNQGDHLEAEKLYIKALEEYRHLNNRRGIDVVEFFLGMVRATCRQQSAKERGILPSARNEVSQ